MAAGEAATELPRHPASAAAAAGTPSLAEEVVEVSKLHRHPILVAAAVATSAEAVTSAVVEAVTSAVVAEATSAAVEAADTLAEVATLVVSVTSAAEAIPVAANITKF